MKTSLILSSTFAGLFSLVAASGVASADGVSVRASGSLSVRAGVHVNVGGLLDQADQMMNQIRFAVPPASVRVTARARPIPRRVVNPCRFRCGAVVPSYYVSRPRPVYSQTTYVQGGYAPPAPVYIAPRVSRWAVGAYAGSVEVDGAPEAMPDLGIMGQFRLSPAFTLEAELSRSERSEISRVDRRVGASVLYDFSPDQTISPYILAGVGLSQTDIGEGAFLADKAYGEVGLGARLRLGHRFQLLADVRLGSRESEDDAVYKTSEPIAPMVQPDEQYARFRLGGLINF